MADEEDTPGAEMGERSRNRLAQRFETDSGPSESDSGGASDTQDAQGAQDDQEPAGGGTESAWDVESVKSAWTGVTIYLPTHLREPLDDEFRRLEYELGGELPDGTPFKKDRHFKPLVLLVGVERVRELSASEVASYLTRMRAESVLADADESDEE